MENPEGLKAVREQCEYGLTPCHIVEDTEKGHVLVVLKQNGESYHCHRYFNFGTNWQFSYDAQGADIDTVWEWLKDPRAMPRV